MNQNMMDNVANASPLWIVGIIIVLTLVRLTLANNKNRRALFISETCDTINFVLVLAFLLIRPFVAQAFVIPSASMQTTLKEGDRLVVEKLSYRFQEPKRGNVIVFNAPEAALIAAGKDPKESLSYIKRLIGMPGDTIRVTKPNLRINNIPVNTSGMRLRTYLATQLGIDHNIADANFEMIAIKLFSDKIVISGPKINKQITKPELAQALGYSPDAKVEITPGRTYRNGVLLDEPYTREDPDYNFPTIDGTPDGEPSGDFVVPPGQLLAFGDNRNMSSDGHMWGTLPRQNLIGHAFCLFLPVNRIGRIR
jgi:signal peptidase I